MLQTNLLSKGSVLMPRSSSRSSGTRSSSSNPTGDLDIIALAVQQLKALLSFGP